MSFVRLSDTFAYDPRTLYPLELDGGDIRHVNECAGFSARLAAESGGKEHEDTDRRVTRSMVLQMAGTPQYADWLMQRLVGAKVWQPDGTGYLLLNDENYIHLLTQEEIERNRTRIRDGRNPRLWARALLRDGDNCRACGRTVTWSDRKSERGGTWQHVDITNQPTQPEEYVVYCFGCQNDPMASLQPAPVEPKFSEKSRGRIRDLLGKWPSASERAEYVSGLRALPGPATARKRTGKKDAADGQRISPEIASDGLRPGEENAAQAAPQRPESDSGNASGVATHGEREGPPEGLVRAPAADQLIRGVTDLDMPGRDGPKPGLVSSGSGGSGLDAARAPASRRSRRSKRTTQASPASKPEEKS